MKCYIYGLCCPDTKEVRYIGQSINPKRRYKEHLNTYTNLLGSWIKELKADNKKPILNILEITTFEEASDKEAEWIGKYNNLLNHPKRGTKTNGTGQKVADDLELEYIIFSDKELRTRPKKSEHRTNRTLKATDREWLIIKQFADTIKKKPA